MSLSAELRGLQEKPVGYRQSLSGGESMSNVIVVPSVVGGWEVRVQRGATFSHHRSREEAERAAEALRARGTAKPVRRARRPV
jgi:hypothetical protein